MQSDPIGLSGGYNTFAYVGNNSLNGVDKFGLDSENDFNPNDSNYSIEINNGKIKHYQNDSRVYFYTAHGGWDINNNPATGAGGTKYYDANAFVNHFINTDYWKRRLKNNQSIILELYACDTGNDKHGTPLGLLISKKLTSILKQMNKTNKVYVLAPSLSLWNSWPWGDDEQPYGVNFFGGKNIFQPGHWNVYENGDENQKLRYPTASFNNPIYNY